MANRKYLLALFMVACCYIAKAQTITFQQADSVSYAQYQSASWKALVDFGNQAITSGVDYPLLRLRIGYAQLMSENYSAALAQYQHVLNDDSRNQTARYFSYLCNKYLDNQNAASYHASFVDTVTLSNGGMTPFGLLTAGLETSVKMPQNSNRGTGSYTRAFLSNRLGWKFTLNQSVAFYNQSITSTTAVTPNPGAPSIATPNNANFTNSQFEYYAKLGYAVSSQITLLGAYHYLNTSFGITNYQSHIGLAGIKYSAPYFSVQGDANFSSISGTNVSQFNGQLNLYPLGNLNFYTFSRVSVQTGDIRQTIFNQTIGFKLAKQIWLEASTGFGTMDNYLDADVLYVYNAIDITKFKTGATAFYPLGQHAVVYLNYTFEQKQDYYSNKNYNQNSITGGFTWKF